MRIFDKTGTESVDDNIRRTIDELIETGVPAVAAHTTGRERSPWSAPLYIVVPLVAIAFLMSMRDTVSSSTASDGSTSPNEGSTTSAVTAESISFDTERLDLAANASVTIHFVNADSSAISHNVAIYQDETASKAIFQGKIIPGGRETDYTFDTPKPGRYFFRCDVHPGMNGTAVFE